MDEQERKRHFMILRQIEARGIVDQRVLEAMHFLPRDRFVPEELRRFAYEDGPLPIGWGQTISQPFIVAYTLETLHLVGGERVLEIGTGSGYEAALLGMLSGEVWSLERVPGLASRASALLIDRGLENVHVILADGFFGLPEKAPFDAIVLSAAPLDLPSALLNQLRPDGGILVGPEGPQGTQSLVYVLRSGPSFERKSLMDVAFVPMLGGVRD
ncbi:MAG: protein-L-isoaspartate(D-aspartate) O-methyltransferase [Spirochaetes bacterium]|nr:protein-L-isoaspartate(D-aspartate) O-methyltransferase [Spirochaetota bacterium]